MKKHRWVWINTAVCICVIALTLLGGFGVQRIVKKGGAGAAAWDESDKFRLDPKDITGISFESGYNGHEWPDIDNMCFKFYTEDWNEIEAFTDCLEAVERNNRNANFDFEAVPHYYNFTFFLTNGQFVSYTYKVYYEGADLTMNDPFDAFFKLDSVQKKMEEKRENFR